LNDAAQPAIALRVAAVVEGHGEVPSAPILLERIWYELLGQSAPIDIVRPPIRQPRDRLVQNKDDAMVKAVELAAAKLSASPPAQAEMILVLFDADKDLPCRIGPATLQTAAAARKDKNIACVVANVEYETWFVAAAESLSAYLHLDPNETLPADPETARIGKGWIEKRFKGIKYSETVDQPKLTSKLDLTMCRRRSPSFDKLCREIEKFVPSKD
jgi:hypothetical protein